MSKRGFDSLHPLKRSAERKMEANFEGGKLHHPLKRGEAERRAKDEGKPRRGQTSSPALSPVSLRSSAPHRGNQGFPFMALGLSQKWLWPRCHPFLKEIYGSKEI